MPIDPLILLIIGVILITGGLWLFSIGLWYVEIGLWIPAPACLKFGYARSGVSTGDSGSKQEKRKLPVQLLVLLND